MASFVGTANILEGAAARRLAHSERPIAIRPELVKLGAAQGGELGAKGKLAEIQYHGATSRLAVDVEGTMFAVSVGGGSEAANLALGSELELSWAREAMVELQ